MRIVHYVLIFFVCFAGVYTALMVFEKFKPEPPKADSLDAFLSRQVSNIPKAEGQVAFEDAAKRLMPTVVSVYRHERDWFGPSGSTQISGAGSGVIITEDGYIVTNFHVIEGAEKITVRLLNGQAFEAEVVGTDPYSDLALLKVNARNLPVADMGNSEDLVIGEWVLAIGNPLGYEGTLSVGVVSALNRDLPGMRLTMPLVDAIQTDAAINSGNSGGALANVRGEVVGINTMIASTDRGSIGIGFAIPSSRVKRFVSDIQKYGRPRHADLGARRFLHSEVLYAPDFERQVGANPPKEGLVLWEVAPESPLDRAGIGRLDVILEVDGVPFRTLSDYFTFLMKSEIGKEVKIKYWQKGEVKTTTVALSEMES